jgi:hypothetical protein
MVLSVSISLEVEAKLKERAAAAGLDLETFAARQLERSVSVPLSVKELSGDTGQAFAESDMTEDELSDFLEAEKHQARAERRGKLLE